MTTPIDDSILIIFGITGDLAKRKILPALYHLIQDDMVPEHFAIVGTSRRELAIDDLLKDVELCVLEQDNTCDPEAMARFRACLTLTKVDPMGADDYRQLHSTLDAIEANHGVCMNRLFYLSIPPQVYGPVVRSLGEHGLNQGCTHGGGRSRLLVEKPFGYDLSSAHDLIETTRTVFSEAQTFRIDHYLAKETAQNILTFRAHNPLFDSIWNNRHIARIDVIAEEKIGIEGRGNFYDSVGALRDLIQSHLMQLLALTTMRVPQQLDDTEQIHYEKQQLLASVTAHHPESGTLDTVRGQYTGYQEEAGNPGSRTETYAALTLWIKQPDWEGVPVRLITGKALAAKRTQIDVHFGTPIGHERNLLRFRIQPDEGIRLVLTAKKPGFAHETQDVEMDFNYQAHFDNHGHPDAYERVLIDAMRGDSLLFATSDEVLASWHALQPVLEQWQNDATELLPYEAGSKGPIRR